MSPPLPWTPSNHESPTCLQGHLREDTLVERGTCVLMHRVVRNSVDGSSPTFPRPPPNHRLPTCLQGHLREDTLVLRCTRVLAGHSWLRLPLDSRPGFPPSVASFQPPHGLPPLPRGRMAVADFRGGEAVFRAPGGGLFLPIAPVRIQVVFRGVQILDLHTRNRGRG